MELFYIKKVLQGDPAPFSYFVKTYKHMAFSIAYRIVHNKEDAEEVVQDSFVKSFRSLSKFRQESKFSTWFYKIVVNTARSRIRTKPPIVVDIDSDTISDCFVETVASAYTLLAHADQVKMINLALDRMVIEDRLLLTVYYLYENSIEEVSEITDIAVENVKMRLHRARKKMYLILSEILKAEIHHIV